MRWTSLRSALGSAALARAAAVWPALGPPAFEGCWLTPKRMLNYYLNQWEHRRCRVAVRSYPIKLIVEPTNVCNLRCPACFTGDGQVGRARGAMPLGLYRRLLDELGDYLFRIDLCNWGEPLLNKQVDVMIAEARARGISTLISTNFSFPFDAARAERLVASGLTVLGVSIDGARQDTYAQYRVRGDLDQVLANCRAVRAAKRRLGSPTPRLVWEFHVFPHNTGDVERARVLARELDMDIAVDKGWVAGPEWQPDSPWQFCADPAPFPCVHLWQYAVVNNDGGVAPCCGSFYPEDDMGRLALAPGGDGAATLREVWNGAAFQQARRLYRTRTGGEAARRSICFDCPQTVLWERWQAHRAHGGAPESFSPGFSTNDVFNYFWNRRPTRAPGDEVRAAVR